MRSKRRRLHDRDRWTCYLCGRPCNPSAPPCASDAPTLDHVVPRRRGGTDAEDNLRTAHVACNHRKGCRRYKPTKMKPRPQRAYRTLRAVWWWRPVVRWERLDKLLPESLI